MTLLVFLFNSRESDAMSAGLADYYQYFVNTVLSELPTPKLLITFDIFACSIFEEINKRCFAS